MNFVCMTGKNRVMEKESGAGGLKDRQFKRQIVKRVLIRTILFCAMVIGICLAAGITSVAGACVNRERERAYDKELEKELVKDVRAFLDEKGYRNSGVMLTRTTYKDGRVEYCLKVHHGLIDQMTESCRQSLLDELSQFEFPKNGYSLIASLNLAEKTRGE